MSNSPKQDSQTPAKSSKRLWLMILSRGSMALGSLLVIFIIGGIWRLRNFIQTELAPLAQQNLTNTLNRPVELGQVKEFSLTGVRFAASAIPATPTDSDWVKIEAVDVSFNPWQLVVNRQLKLDVTLINPNVYVEQDDQKRWITTTIAPPGKPGIIKTDLDILRFQNARLILVGNPITAATEDQKNQINLPSPQSPVPVIFSGLYGKAQLVANNQRIKFDVSGKPENGGNIFLQGELQAKANLDGKLQLKTEDLLAADVTRLIPLPLNLATGRINGDLQIELIPEQPTLLNGNATLQAVTLQIPKVPQDLSNTQGNIKFQGLAIELDNVVSNYGKIPLKAKGVIDREKGFNLAATVNAVSVNNALETLKVKSPLPVSGIVKADLQILGDIENPVLSGNVTNIKTAQIDKIDLQKVSGKFELSPRDFLITLKDIQGQTTLGGEVTGAGKIIIGEAPRIDVNFQSQNIPGDAIAKVYNDKINSTLKIGTVSATANISGVPDDVKTLVKWQAPQATYPTTGETIVNSDRTVDFRNVAVNVDGNIIRGYGSYNQENWQAIAEVSGVKIAPFLKPEQLENIALGNTAFNGKFVISGSSGEEFKITNIRAEDAGINIGGGRVNIARLQLEDKNFVADLIANDVRLGKVLKPSLPILNNPLTGKFTIAGNTENFNLKTLGAVGSGSLTIGNGKITANNIQVSNGNYKAQVTANNLPLQKLADIPPQLTDKLAGILGGEFNVAGSVESFKPETIQATGKAKLNLAGGTVTASNIQIANGNYQAFVNSSGVKLNRLNKQLSGQFASNLQVAGIIGSAKLADMRAAGQVQFSQGLPGLNSPLNAAIVWNGQQLTIPQARTENINASGYILANAQQPGIPEITQLNLNVQAKNYDLQQLPVKLPNAVNVAGKADFQGQITGKPTAPNVAGVLGLRNLQVQKFAFEPLLTGQINFISGKGLNVDIAGQRDRLAARLNANNQPSEFLVKWQQASASGEAKGDNWNVKINNFPLQDLNLKLPDNPIYGQGAVAGLLTGDLQINQKTFVTRGNIAIAQPQLGRIKGNNLTTQLNYKNNTATLTNSKFTAGKSNYNFDASIKQTTTGPQLQAKVDIDKAEIKDILSVAQIFEIQDFQRGLKPPQYGTSADLTTLSQGLPNQSLLNQIQRLAEIDALVEETKQQRIDSQPLPYLTDIKGTLSGQIEIDTATKNGLKLDFDLNGNEFAWGKKMKAIVFTPQKKSLLKVLLNKEY
jgi:translocation and assembly module TamB